MPSMPSHCRMIGAGNAPRPISVEVTGAPVSFLQFLRSSAACGPELMTPPPV